MDGELRDTAFKIRRKLIAELKACCSSKNLDGVKRIHKVAAQSGSDSNVVVANTLIDMYAKCGSMQESCRVFDHLKNPDVVSWTALILGYANNGENETALKLFSRMECKGFAPVARTYVAALKACTNIAVKQAENGKFFDRASSLRGRAVQLLAAGAGYDSNLYVQSSLVDMYARVGRMKEARDIFDTIQSPDVVSWTALVSGYANNGLGDVALNLLARISPQDRSNERMFVAALKACTDLALKDDGASLGKGRRLHMLVLRYGSDSNVFVQSTLIDMYAKLGCMEDAREVFNRTMHPNVVCWTALILGYADHGQSSVALSLFSEMENAGCAPTIFTYFAMLKACSTLGALELGRRLHAAFKSRGFSNKELLTNALLEFYVKCGSLTEARDVFDSHDCRNLETWTTLMAGYSCHGDTARVFELFDRMIDKGLNPDGVIFNCILSACSHAGLVEKGIGYFTSMTRRYGVIPCLEHYVNMIDMLGRSNRLDDAMELHRSMPFSSNAATWTTILGACGKWKNAVLGRLAFETLTILEDGSSGAYVAMANIYGSKETSDDQSRLRTLRTRSSRT